MRRFTIVWALLVAAGCHRHRARAARCPPATVAVVDAAVTAAVDASAPVAVPEIVPRARRSAALPLDADWVIPDGRASGLPTARPPSARCSLGADVTAWLAHDPHVPLARVTSRGIQPAGQACCEPFAVRGSRWREVDRWGQVVGESTVRDGGFYDVTRCFELVLAPQRAGSSGLFASASGPWRPSPSLRHDPEPAQWADAVALDGRLRAIPTWSRSVSDLAAPQARALFFRWRATAYEGDDATPSDWLALGGRGLVLARWEDDRWQVVELLLRAGGAARVTPIAVFDLDADGTPEVIVENDAGDAWGTAVFQRSSDGGWREVARSIGGSTA